MKPPWICVFLILTALAINASSGNAHKEGEFRHLFVKRNFRTLENNFLNSRSKQSVILLYRDYY